LPGGSGVTQRLAVLPDQLVSRQLPQLGHEAMPGYVRVRQRRPVPTEQFFDRHPL
jgi:hypothetical protein